MFQKTYPTPIKTSPAISHSRTRIYLHRFIRNPLRGSTFLSKPLSFLRRVCDMPKDRRKTPVSSSVNRVSPYPLRSCRNKKQKEVESPVELESVNEWKDVRCVICMEPPHNAVLLKCSSLSKGCRAYMCDTSARLSNCYKQYRRNNNISRCNVKTLHCPYCRGEVHGTTKSTCARRFMNAKPRSCSVDKCNFSGTYSQLKTHLKTEHPGFTPPKLDSWEQIIFEQMEREAEYNEIINARQRWESEHILLASTLHQLRYRHPTIDLNFDAFVDTLFHGSRSLVSTSNSPAQIP